VLSTFLAASAMAQAPAAAPPPPGAAPPGAPPPAYGPPPPGYYYAPPPQNMERTAFNNLFVEGLGPGLWYSFNYERIISDFSIRAGIGYISISASNGVGDSAHAYFLTVPVDVNYIGLGGKKHIFELGGGLTVLAVGAGASAGFGSDTASGSATSIIGHLNLGYRMQPPQGGFMMRAGISPLIGSGVFLPWPYISLGAAF